MESGYFIENDVFTAQECDALITELTALMSTKKAGIRNLMSNTIVSKLANDPRLIELAKKGLEHAVMPFRATLFDKSFKTNWLVGWHQDITLPLENIFDDKDWGSWSKKAGINYALAPTWALKHIVALRIHLDDSTTENGSLKVIPQSHLLGVLKDNEVINYFKSNVVVECTVSKGGVLAMSPLILHSSSKAQNNLPRRVLHIEYSDTLELKPGIKLAKA